MSAIITLLITLINAFSFLMFVWVLLSWLPEVRYTPFYRFLDRICDPYLEIFRRIVPPINGIDISPIFGFFALQMLTNLLGYFR